MSKEILWGPGVDNAGNLAIYGGSIVKNQLLQWSPPTSKPKRMIPSSYKPSFNIEVQSLLNT